MNAGLTDFLSVTYSQSLALFMTLIQQIAEHQRFGQFCVRMRKPLLIARGSGSHPV